MPDTLNPNVLAQHYVEESKKQIENIGESIHVVGLIASDDEPSIAYAAVTKQKFDNIGISYDLRKIQRLELEDEILKLNDDPSVHGIFIHFPVFHNQQDDYLRNLVQVSKDIEAGSNYWTRKLYNNDRFVDGDPTKKALLPCTPLAIVKMLTEIGVYQSNCDKPIDGKTVTIYNRSEVIGRPLAVMMSNDGALIHSFDENGPLTFKEAKAFESSITRAEALAASDIVITGVPSKKFEKVRVDEIKPDTVCVNFSSIPNFDDDINTHTEIYIPRVGPMTVAMCMRNTVRLFNNFHRTKT